MSEQIKLRKVRFNLNEQNLSLGDIDYEDSDSIMMMRNGYFHRFGDVICYDPKQGKNYQKTIAIVEEMETGDVFEVAPHCISFEQV